MKTSESYLHKKYINLGFRLKRLVSNLNSTQKLDYPGKDIEIYVDTPREYYTRSHSCQKEPGTIQWLEKHIKPGTVFYDVGANIGAYTLVAGALGAKVFAFEPAFQNFNQCNRNITLNGMDSNVSLFPVAFSTQTKIANFKYIEMTPGTSRCYYNEEGSYHLNIPPVVEKATIILSLDSFLEIFNLPEPEMLKIDVDGGERDVINGAKQTMKNTTLKSIQIEVDETERPADDIKELIQSYGFKLTSQHKFQKNVSNFVFDR